MGILKDLFPDGVLGIKGVERERATTDEMIARVQNDDSLTGLGDLVAQGQEPMTAGQHQKFRAALGLAVDHEHTINTGVADVNTRIEALRKSNPDLSDTLDTIQTKVKLAHAHALDPDSETNGMAVLTGAINDIETLQKFDKEEKQQTSIADQTGRFNRRKEIQTDVDTRLVKPWTEDTANYGALRAQIPSGQDGKAAPKELNS
jgi:hypothetical protein